MSYLYMPDDRVPQNVIVLSDSVYHSYQGSYFLGQTETIRFGGEFQGWGGLVNPPDSKVNMFLNAYTISNYNEQPLTVEGWLSSKLPGIAVTSRHFAAGNQSIVPQVLPEVMIQSANFVASAPKGGSYTFTRRVEPSITLTKHDFQGMYVIPPGSSFVLFFMPEGNVQLQVKVAFGWWEE